MEADNAAPESTLPLSELRFTPIYSYSYMDERKVAADFGFIKD